MAIICASLYVIQENHFEKVKGESLTEPNQARTLRDLIQLSLSTGIPHVPRQGDKYVDENNINWNDPTVNPNYGYAENFERIQELASEVDNVPKDAGSTSGGSVPSGQRPDEPAPNAGATPSDNS